MRHNLIAVGDALQGAQRFLDETAGLRSDAVDFTAARKWLDELVAIFVENAIEQDIGDRGARDATAKQHELRMKLRREHMEPISVIARLTLRERPELLTLRMPKLGTRGWDFIPHARAMAATAAIYKDVFLKHGLPSTFLTDFESVIAKLEESVSDRQQDVVRRISARLQLELAATHGRVVLRVLDALVRRAAADNESLLRGWEAARLIRRSSVRESTSIVA